VTLYAEDSYEKHRNLHVKRAAQRSAPSWPIPRPQVQYSRERIRVRRNVERQRVKLELQGAVRREFDWRGLDELRPERVFEPAFLQVGLAGGDTGIESLSRR
jgi:hypothetical protein